MSFDIRSIVNKDRSKQIDFFLAFFGSIPESEWGEGGFTHNGRYCALGHCAYKLDWEIAKPIIGDILNENVVAINDGVNPQFKQSTPKSRIMAALNLVKNGGNIYRMHHGFM